MTDNLTVWKSFIGEAFNVKRPEQGEDDKTYFTLKTLTKSTFINCTLWDNSHGHVEVNKGDMVIVNGKFKKKAKSDGDGFWYNLSVTRIAVIPMDDGVDDRDGYEDDGEEDEAPKAKPARKRKAAPAADEGKADEEDVL